MTEATQQARSRTASAVFYRSPDDNYPTIVRGNGCYLWDDEGTRYLDLSSGFAVAAGIGHGRDDVADAMAAQARRLSYVHNARVTNDRQEELAFRLAEHAPPGVDRVMFTSGGSEANELSLRIARQYHLAQGEPSRWKVISLHQSYHGATAGALAMTGRVEIRQDYEPYLAGFPKIPPPVLYRGPWAGLEPADAARRAADALADAIEAEGPDTVAAFIGEPISASTGSAVPPDGYWPRIRDICDHYGILLIADEIITGVGRTGTFLCLEHFGVTADLTNLAKGLSGGYVPLGATLIRNEVAEGISDGKRRMAEVHTYSGAPISCAIGLSVLDAIEREGLIDAARERGAHLRSVLEEQLGDVPCVGDIRGLGLMQAVEYVRSRETREPYPAEAEFAKTISQRLWSRGFVIGGGRLCAPTVTDPLVADCTGINPMLIVTDELIDSGVEALREVIDEVSAEWEG
jgi:adenosylmethionine-8-amino-7-oxononanoate aminotransferase